MASETDESADASEMYENRWDTIAPCPNCGAECQRMTQENGSALCTNQNCSVEMYDPEVRD